VDARVTYEALWAHDAYRIIAPGEHHVQRFIDFARPRTHHVVCDFGCGTGRGAYALAALHNLSVCAVDFASNCLDDGVRESLGERFRFLQHDLTTALDERFDFGYCTDVLEHIDPADVDTVLKNIGTSAKKVYFAISTVPDVMGALVGEPLHLTVESPWWWHDKLTEVGYRIDRSEYGEGWVVFWASMYRSAEDFVDQSSINVELEQIKDNIRKNLSLGLQEVVPHAKQDTVVYLLAGGPSLNDFEQQIIESGRAGVPCITMNGTYNWLLERGIKPAAQIMVDARKFNSRFIEPRVDTCKYLISSQCDHDVLKSLPSDRTWLWHPHNESLVREVFDETGCTKEWYPVSGGSTVASSALVLLAMLGFRRVEVFGMDSCIRADKHHAYSQVENDSDHVVEFTAGGRKFLCHPWMAIQARDIQYVIRNVLSKIDDFEMIVHGDGLISHILQTAADEAARSN